MTRVYSFYTYFFYSLRRIIIFCTYSKLLRFSVGAKIGQTENNIMFNKVEFIKKERKRQCLIRIKLLRPSVISFISFMYNCKIPECLLQKSNKSFQKLNPGISSR